MSHGNKNIAVICAPQPDRNTGMFTVDLSAFSYMQKNYPDCNVSYYVFSDKDERQYSAQEQPFTYKNIIKDAKEFLASDVFLYWGDFVHSNTYWELDMKFLEHGLDKSANAELKKKHEDRLSNRKKLIFLNEMTKEALKRVIVFGSTIITNEAADVKSVAYTKEFDYFFRNIGNVYFRDALSAAKISPMRGSEATLACDCAFLLENSDFNKLPGFKLADKRQDVGVFFGRSSSKLSMMIFSKLLGCYSGQKCVWLPWFISTPKMTKVAKLFGYNVPKDHLSPSELLSALSGYKFVVTDTYHMCINAWRMGVPAICIGQGDATASNSIADKKKEILYEMYGARPFYIFLGSLTSVFKQLRTAKAVAKVVEDEVLINAVIDNIQSHRAMALERLNTALTRALSISSAKEAA